MNAEPTAVLRSRIVRRRRNSGIVRCEPGWDWRPRPLSDYDLWHVVAGSGTISVNGTAYPAGPGDCFLLRPGDRIAASQHPDDRLTVIYVHFELAPADERGGPGSTSGTSDPGGLGGPGGTGSIGAPGGIGGEPDAYSGGPDAHSGGPGAPGGIRGTGGLGGLGGFDRSHDLGDYGCTGKAETATDPLADHWPSRRYPVAEPYRLEAHLRELVELDQEGAPDAEALFETLAKHVLLQLRRAVAAGGENAVDRRRKLAVRRAVEHIRARLADVPSHGELAETAGLSPRYFAKVFRDETGIPLRTFIARARLERAAQLLAETSMNVQQVADALGYADIYLFSKQFKKAYGVPPSRMRHRS